jgi:hypothetical protein
MILEEYLNILNNYPSVKNLREKHFEFYSIF